MNHETLKDILGWDVLNWEHALKFLEGGLPQNKHDLKALELGSGFNGGLSLWLALKGIQVTCSGYNPKYTGVSDKAKEIHIKYQVNHLIKYEEINANDIPYKSTFDIVCYKSVLGGIVRNQEISAAEKIIDQIILALKPGGVLLFSENISSTQIHEFLRNKAGSGKNNWHYFSIEELCGIHQQFHSLKYKTFGLTGCFGRNETQRRLLGKLDNLLFKNIIPKQWNYIFSGIAIKKHDD